MDVSHAVPAFDLHTAGFLVWAGTHAFPAGTVHLAVVDPGVGTSRRALALRVGDSYFVGPDNGLFSMVIRECREGAIQAVELARPAASSRTFEGRDVFAPAAARLAAGEPMAAIGAAAVGPKILPDPGPRVLWVDRWGNLITSLKPPLRGLKIRGHEVSASAPTFGDAPRDQLFHYVGSMGLIEVAVREGRAASLLDVEAGELVIPLS